MRNLDSKIEKKSKQRKGLLSDIFHDYCYLGFKETQSALLCLCNRLVLAVAQNTGVQTILFSAS